MSFSNHPLARAMSNMGILGKPVAQAEEKKPGTQMLDSVQNQRLQVFDAVETLGAASYAVNDIRVSVAATIQQWAETDDLEEGKTLADRLFAMLVGIADDDQDGEINDDEQAVLDVAMDSAFDYLVSKGVTEDDATALLQDGSAEAADRVADLLKGELPDGDEASMTDIDTFAFDSDAQASVFDSVDAIMDAVYKKAVVVRNGKKTKIMKRVAGKVTLSPEEKIAIRKAGMKAHSAAAKVARMKSMRVRARMGLNKK